MAPRPHVLALVLAACTPAAPPPQPAPKVSRDPAELLAGQPQCTPPARRGCACEGGMVGTTDCSGAAWAPCDCELSRWMAARSKALAESTDPGERERISAEVAARQDEIDALNEYTEDIL